MFCGWSAKIELSDPGVWQNSPEKFELEEKTFSTDYAYIRAGSRGKELTVSDKSDQYAKFFTVGAKQILMPDEDEDDLVWG